MVNRITRSLLIKWVFSLVKHHRLVVLFLEKVFQLNFLIHLSQPNFELLVLFLKLPHLFLAINLLFPHDNGRVGLVEINV